MSSVFICLLFFIFIKVIVLLIIANDDNNEFTLTLGVSEPIGQGTRLRKLTNNDDNLKSVR